MSEANKMIEAIADVFNICGEGFEDFKKKAGSNVSDGYCSTAASSGYCSTAASSGNNSKAASSGYCSTAASSGYCSTAASSGNYSTAASSGIYSGCTAIGYRAAVKGDIGNLIMASEYINNGGKYTPIGGRADIVDGKKLRAQQWYIVEGGEWVAVDYTDGIFSRVLSIKGGIKKVKTDGGDVLYVVSDDNGNHAHGATLKEARESLIYKAVASFDGKLPKKATGKEWVGIYRAVTGACAVGVQMFVREVGGDLDKEYTAKKITKLIKGRFGYEKFMEKLNASN